MQDRRLYTREALSFSVIIDKKIGNILIDYFFNQILSFKVQFSKTFLCILIRTNLNTNLLHRIIILDLTSYNDIIFSKDFQNIWNCLCLYITNSDRMSQLLFVHLLSSVDLLSFQVFQSSFCVNSDQYFQLVAQSKVKIGRFDLICQFNH